MITECLKEAVEHLKMVMAKKLQDRREVRHAKATVKMWRDMEKAARRSA